MTSAQPNPCRQEALNADNFEIWCDKPADKLLLQSLKSISGTINEVTKIDVLPPNSQIRTLQSLEFVKPLVKYDRADFLVFYRKSPILMVEMTEHGYTGDNSLQRFARLVNAGEEKVPVIYFTPFSRTRLDEIEATEEDTSKRHVSLNLFRGMKRISEIHHVPVIAVDWPVNQRGLPMTFQRNASSEKKKAVFGKLSALLDHIIGCHTSQIERKVSIMDCAVIKSSLGNMDVVMSNIFLRETEVKLENVNFDTIARLIMDPSRVIELLGEHYFFKGKDQKLIALLALTKSRIGKIETTENSLRDVPETSEEIMRIFPSELRKRNSVVYFCGYEKRSEPNGGIITNIDYVICRTGPTTRNRVENLVVVWPRVFYSKESKTARFLIDDLHKTVHGSNTSALHALIAKKVKLLGDDMTNHRYIAATTSSIGFWSETDTIGGICREFCDILILNDTVLLGSQWKSQVGKTNVTLDSIGDDVRR